MVPPPELYNVPEGQERMTQIMLKHFGQPAEFTSMLQTTHGLVTGSVVVAVVSNSEWNPGDLYIVVAEHWVVPLNNYLKCEGYQVSMSWLLFGFYRTCTYNWNNSWVPVEDPVRWRLDVLYQGQLEN